ncbi:unnamed protein product [Lathyrus sativus]|nr:unnamed protein product [Lathyrus sativus]
MMLFYSEYHIDGYLPDLSTLSGCLYLMANIVGTVADKVATNVGTNVTNYFAGRIIREIQYLFCIDNLIDDLENEKMALTSERDSLRAQIVLAKERTEVIEEPVVKWLNDVENLLQEVEVLLKRTESDNNCFQGWFPTCGRYILCKQMAEMIEEIEKFNGKRFKCSDQITLKLKDCRQLHIFFPSECKLQNLKILRLQDCRTDEVLFSASVAQNLQQLEELRITGCNELKHIIAASGSEHDGCNTSEEIIPTLMNSHFLMTNLREVNILDCGSLESLFPICYVEGLKRLQNLEIVLSPKLEYVFGEYGHEHFSSHQYEKQVMLPRLESLILFHLDNFIGMCPKNCQAKWPSQTLRTVAIVDCPKLDVPWLNLQVGYDKRQHHHHLNEIWSFQCLQHLSVGNSEKLKCFFSMETHRSLPELIELRVYDCQELEQIVAASEELVQLPNAEVYFQKLESMYVNNCNKLKNLFPLAMVRMLPQLSTLTITNCTQLEEVFRHGPGGDNIIGEKEVVLPNLTDIKLEDLPNFVDICYGYKLHAVKLQELRIYNCPKTVANLKNFR